MVNRRGESRLGCLLGLLILAVGAYLAIDFGEAYFRYYQYKDAMGQEARFATDKTDDQISARLSALADSLELPPGAELINIQRGPSVITISSDYDEVIKAPLEEGAGDPLPSNGGEQALRPRDPATKVATWTEAAQWREQTEGRLAFTNGVFDLLHPGHIDVLTAARQTADALVVGINSDESVRRLKGPTRPVRTDTDRAYVLAALECVDLVVVFPEDTPLNLVRHLRPDVIVKGGDYTEDTIVGADEVKSWGGRVVVVPLTPGHSTTSIIQTLGDKP